MSFAGNLSESLLESRIRYPDSSFARLSTPQFNRSRPADDLPELGLSCLSRGQSTGFNFFRQLWGPWKSPSSTAREPLTLLGVVAGAPASFHVGDARFPGLAGSCWSFWPTSTANLVEVLSFGELSRPNWSQTIPAPVSASILLQICSAFDCMILRTL